MASLTTVQELELLCAFIEVVAHRDTDMPFLDFFALSQ